MCPPGSTMRSGSVSRSGVLIVCLTNPKRNVIVPATERLPLKHVHVCVSALGSGFTMHDEMLLIFRLLSLTRCTCGCSGSTASWCRCGPSTTRPSVRP